MSLTPIIFTAKPRHRRKRREISSSAVETGLVLVSALYEPTASVTLTFDRPIDVADVNCSAITVDDGMFGFRFVAVEANLLSATTVELVLNGIDELPFVGVKMNATASNGIVAAGDAAAWAGALELELPFP
jgi:hypothetical protein